jgi:hypothetical protein
MNEHGKSDNPIIPGKFPNKAEMATEAMEGRELAKGNRSEQNALRTQGRVGVQRALGRIRQVWRHHLRQEPGAVVPHAWSLDSEYFRKICAGGAG